MSLSAPLLDKDGQSCCSSDVDDDRPPAAAAPLQRGMFLGTLAALCTLASTLMSNVLLVALVEHATAAPSVAPSSSYHQLWFSVLLISVAVAAVELLLLHRQLVQNRGHESEGFAIVTGSMAGIGLGWCVLRWSLGSFTLSDTLLFWCPFGLSLLCLERYRVLVATSTDEDEQDEDAEDGFLKHVATEGTNMILIV